MTGYFPDPYPDELFYSLCARFSTRMQYEFDQAVTEDLFGAAKMRPSLELPCYLDRLVKALPPGHPCTIDQLINWHTQLPFYSPFLPAQRVAQLRERMRGNDAQGIYLYSGRAASRMPSLEQLRYCPMCVKQDRRQWGEAYWHRVHQLVGIDLCPQHSVPLRPCHEAVWQQKGLRKFLSAEEALGKLSSHGIVEDEDFTGREVRCRLAREAAWLLAHPQLVAGPEALHTRYLILLADKGFATYLGSKIYLSKLNRAFREYYSPEFLVALNCPLEGRIENNWLDTLIRCPLRIKHPLYHLLLINFLGYTVEQLLNLSGERKPFGEGPWPCLNGVCKHYHQPVILTCEVFHSQSRGARPVGVFRCGCGFAYSRTGPDQTTADRFRRGRIITYGAVCENAVRQLWPDLTFDKQKLEAHFKLSLPAIRNQALRLGLKLRHPMYTSQLTPPAPRHIPYSASPRLLEKRRSAWLAILADQPQATITQLRADTKICSLHSWLLAYDNAWVKLHTPYASKPEMPATRLNWEEMDEQLAAAVSRTAQEIRAVPGRPVRVTFQAIGKRLGQLQQMRANQSKLPKMMTALSQWVETAEDYAIRLIWWMAESYRQEQRCPTLSEFKQRFPVLYHFVKNYPRASQTIDEVLQYLKDNCSRQTAG